MIESAPTPWRKRWHRSGSSVYIEDANGVCVADVTNWMRSKADCDKIADLIVAAAEAAPAGDAEGA